jgi:hypothetical protein
VGRGQAAKLKVSWASLSENFRIFRTLECHHYLYPNADLRYIVVPHSVGVVFSSDFLVVSASEQLQAREVCMQPEDQKQFT